MRQMLKYPTSRTKDWPVFDGEMIEAAVGVLQSGKGAYWTGDEGRRFESEFAQLLGVPSAVSLTNGTAALELSLRALGIGPGDDVVTSPRSFIASAGSIVMRGARPVFADVDRRSGTILAETIEAVLTPATRAVIVVHLGGWPCDLDPICELASLHGIKVIEDVAQALGGTYNKQPLGSVGDVGTFSFCNDKIVSTGEGGMLVAREESILRRVWSLRDHGRRWEDARTRTSDVGPYYRWVRDTFGTNCRMAEVPAAIGRVALRRLPHWIAMRRKNALLLAECLGDVPALRIPEPPDGHAHYRLYTYIRPEQLKSGWTRDRILAELHRRNVPCSVGVCGELYLERAFDNGFRPKERLATACELGETSLAFPVHPALTENDMCDMGEGVRCVLNEAAL